MTNIFDDLPRPFFVLAPMDDVTDTVFRQMVDDCAAPDVYFTEFVNVDGLQSPGRKHLLKKLLLTAHEGLLVAQLWGKKPENYNKTARELLDGTFARELKQAFPEVVSPNDDIRFVGIDINMGCPAKTVVQNGCCSALIDNRALAGEIVQAAREGARGVVPHFPISVKTRLGTRTVDLTWHEYLLNMKLNMLTIHGRTAKNMSDVPANWQLIEEVRKLRDHLSPDTLIVGNGDVMSRQHGTELAEKHGLDGIMVGRSIFSDPYLFSQKSPWENLSKDQRKELYKRHIELFAATWPDGERRIQTLNKFCKVYMNGFEGAKEAREQLMDAGSTQELLGRLAGV